MNLDSKSAYFPAVTDLNHNLDWTGERYVPSIDGEIQLEHHLRYLFARNLCVGKKIVDIASGDGYGTFMLAQVCESAVGVEIDPNAVGASNQNYKRENLSFVEGECCAIPLDDCSQDVVVSFETIEHIKDQKEFLAEVDRILKDTGIFVCSSPIKEKYDDTLKKPNEYHVKELTEVEFKELVEEQFDQITWFDQGILSGGGIFNDSSIDQIDYYTTGDAVYYHQEHNLFSKKYKLCVASKGEIILPRSTFLHNYSYTAGSVQQLERSMRAMQNQYGSIDVSLLVKQLSSFEEQLKAQQLRNSSLQKDLERAVQNCNLIVGRRLSDTDVKINQLLNNQKALQDSHEKLFRQISFLVKESRIGLRGRLKFLFSNSLLKWFLKQRDLRIIKESRLFDADFYLRANPDIAQSGKKPLTHYFETGYKENRDPNTVFDTSFYIANNPDVIRSGINPLLHFIKFGADEDRDPSDTFSLYAFKQDRPNCDFSKKNPLRIYFDEFEAKHGKQEFESDVRHLPSTQQLEKTRLIAFYLPQYHAIPENDKWWGKDFTEWTNVKRSKAFFNKHQQPMLPGEFGMYDLNDDGLIEKQALLAKQHGVFGFCFYYYWFNGKRLLEMPLDNLLKNKEQKVNFCICWANEDWTRSWDGLSRDVLMAQTHEEASDLKFIRDVIPILKDSRYIRVDGKPLLMVYRPEIMVNPREAAKIWRKECRKAGVGEIQLVSALFRVNDPAKFGFDAAVEFPPHFFPSKTINHEVLGLSDDFEGEIRDYKWGVEEIVKKPPRFKFKTYRGVMPGWDNTPRRMNSATVFHGSTPDLYKKWLSSAIANGTDPGEDNLVFVNAWNEWAECACLEPTEDNGRAYLEKTKEVFEEPGPDIAHLPFSNDGKSRAYKQFLKRRRGLQKLKIYCLRFRFFVWAASRFPNFVGKITKLIESEPACGNENLNQDVAGNQQKDDCQLILGSRKKILFVAHDLAMAGSQIVLLDILKWLKTHSQGIEFSVFVLPNESDNALKARYQQICEVVAWNDCVSNDKLDRDKVFQLFGNLDLVYCNTIVCGEKIEELSLLNCPIVTHVHELQESILSFSSEESAKAVSQYSDFVIPVSPPVRDNLIKNHSYDSDKMELIYPFISNSLIENKELFVDKIEKIRKLPGKVVFGCGSPDWRKGPDIFIETARFVRERYDDLFSFVWVGDFTAEMQQLVERENLTDVVHFIGRVDCPRWYFEHGDVFFLSSREDPYPLVALEALDSLLPIVCFKETGGIPLLVEEKKCGIVSENLNAESAAESIISLFYDEGLRKRLGNVGQSIVREKHYADSTVPHLILRSLQFVAKKKPKVSVVLPNYNYGRYLSERIEGILNQSYKDFELIILDDNSTDDSMEVISRYADHPSVSFILKNERNSGSVFKQWMKGLNLAQGEFVWIAEADDLCEKDFLEKMLDSLESSGAILAYCHSKVIDSEGVVNELFNYNTDWLFHFSDDKWNTSYLKSGIDEVESSLGVANTVMNVSSVLFRNVKVNYSEIEFFLTKFKYSGDWLFYIFMCKFGSFKYFCESLNYHRRHNRSVATNCSESMDELMKESFQIHEYIFNNFAVSDEFRERVVNYLNMQVDWMNPSDSDSSVDFLNRYKELLNDCEYEG